MTEEDEPKIIVKDSNGTELNNGDSVTPIKDLKVKGTSLIIKRGTLIKNIYLTDDSKNISCHSGKIKDLLLETQYLKKA